MRRSLLEVTCRVNEKAHDERGKDRGGPAPALGFGECSTRVSASDAENPDAEEKDGRYEKYPAGVRLTHGLRHQVIDSSCYLIGYGGDGQSQEHPQAGNVVLAGENPLPPHCNA